MSCNVLLVPTYKGTLKAYSHLSGAEQSFIFSLFYCMPSEAYQRFVQRCYVVAW